MTFKKLLKVVSQNPFGILGSDSKDSISLVRTRKAIANTENKRQAMVPTPVSLCKGSPK